VTLRATRIGYSPADQQVTVPADGDVTVNFALSHAATRLEEVVTTATGEQSRRQMGNVVATVAADSIVKQSPVNTIGDLLQARSSGVQVVQTSGVIGGSPNIRIRGNGSLSLSNEPLVYVDGVRYNTESEPGNPSGINQNRMSSLNPEEIESIDVIKGPSAAALYGTAAANGVIVIKTKKGRAGSTHWSVFDENGVSSIPNNYPSNYWTFGRNIVNGVPVTGASPVHCTLSSSARGLCVIDSTSSYNPWKDSRTDPFANGPTSHYGFQANGGSDALRFFVSADREGDTGPYHMPSFEQNRITQIQGQAPPNWQVNPNKLNQTSIRGNFTFSVAQNATLDLSTGYQDRDLWTPFDGTFFQGLSNQLFTAPGYLTASNGTAGQYVGDIFGVGQREQLERFLASGSFNWTPLTWLQLTAEGGVDNANSNDSRFQYPGWGPTTSAWGPTASQGFSGIDITRTNTLQYTSTIRGQATRKLSNALTSTTTVGGQWFKLGDYQLFGEGFGLGVGSTTPTAAAQRLASTTTTENATYGAFAQEQLDWNERLFLTAAARIDKNSAFGRANGTTIYPSANASYVISEEPWFPKIRGLDQLKLRTSVGQAGLPPSTTAALQFLSALTYPSAGGDVPGLTVQSLGNPTLKPEITTEYEAGFDAGIIRNRVNVEFTYYNKSTRDALFNKPLPPAFGVGTNQFVNLAEVTNKGVELAVDATVFDMKDLSWNVRVNGSHNTNKLVAIGNVSLPTSQGVRNVVGYPLFGIWDRPYTYSDANHDGIIVPSEITLAAKDAYRGSTLPLYEAGISNNFGLFQNRVHVSGLVDYRGDFWNTYTIGSNRCVSALNCAAVNIAGSPLDQQAAAVAAASGSLNNTRWGIYAPNDFIKLREISVSAELPQSLTNKYLHGRSAQLVLSGRNLATLWTKYPGIDPEANRQANGNDDLGTPPALRYWMARINLAF
jgi:TonB-linked SusC/RagA family outer membrane protein